MNVFGRRPFVSTLEKQCKNNTDGWTATGGGSCLEPRATGSSPTAIDCRDVKSVPISINLQKPIDKIRKETTSLICHLLFNCRCIDWIHDAVN